MTPSPPPPTPPGWCGQPRVPRAPWAAWAAPVALGTGTSPRLAVNPSGLAVVVYRDASGTVEAAVRPAGGVWGAAETFCASCDKTALAVDAEGNAVAAWVCSFRGESRVRPAAPGFVSAWSAADLATPTNVTPTQPQLAMDARGTTVMVFRDVSTAIESVARPGSGRRWAVLHRAPTG